MVYVNLRKRSVLHYNDLEIMFSNLPDVFSKVLFFRAISANDMTEIQSLTDLV